MDQFSALILTLVVELAVVVGYRATVPKPLLSLPASMVICVAASCLTHPIAWWCHTHNMNPLETWSSLACLEVMVIGIEGLVYCGILGYPRGQAWILSGLANAASCAAGLLLLAFAG